MWRYDTVSSSWGAVGIAIGASVCRVSLDHTIVVYGPPSIVYTLGGHHMVHQEGILIPFDEQPPKKDNYCS